jgi:hypothetical protein
MVSHLEQLHRLQRLTFPHGLPDPLQSLGRNILHKPEAVVKVMISTDTADNTIQRYRLDPVISGVEGGFFFLYRKKYYELFYNDIYFY